MDLNLRDHLREIRRENGEIIWDMAKRLGMSSLKLSSIETGKEPIPENFLDKVEAAYSKKRSSEVKTVITKIRIETDVPDKQLTDENIERYKNNILRTIQNEVDDDADIKVEIEII